MTPFSGVGVNLAMEDALELSKFIRKFIDKQSALSDAIEDYEASMLSRATQNAQDTLDNLNMMFSGDTTEEIVLQMQRVMGGGPDDEDRR
jgi:2-polyprenyl-6-methoxyphenol hydroxylase-like FAD-dependent oxidoreductase